MSKCRECGKAVSTLAKTCPNCGVPKPVKKTKKVSKKKSIKKIKICCSSSECQNWFKPVTVNESKDLSKFSCSRCGGTVKKYSSKTEEEERRKIKEQTEQIAKKLKKVWVHCRNYKCKDYTQMLHIYEEYINLDLCSFCGSKVMEAKMVNGKPVMPTGGIYDKIKDKDEVQSSSKNYSKNSSIEKSAYDKFFDGTLDLATAFWLFGVLGSFALSLILTLLAESFSKIFYIPFAVLNAGIIAALWECAENYKKEKLQKKQSAVWGYLTQVFCAVGALGLISTIYDIIKTL